MEFGRLKSVEGIDLTLPRDHPGTEKVLGGKRADNLRVYIGAPVWSDEGFPGTLYPPKARAKDFVKYYGRQYNSIELNATHYRNPEPEAIKRWLAVVPEDFRFCPKVHQEISHAGSLTHMIPQMKSLMLLWETFKPKLGLPFLQLPPQLHHQRADELLTFLDAVMPDNLAIEIRHEGWFEPGNEAMRQVCNYMYRNRYCLVITDVAGRRDVMHMRLTSRKVFIRFQANDLHPSDYIRMDAWVERLAQWLEQGLEELYFFVHNPDKSLIPELSVYFIKAFNRRTGLQIPVPRLYKTEAEPDKLF
ncbi:MAG: DUF72 domain-containing protein [Bacteroidetes bacterium]|nr:DUF72 domain-containing protein [Bacteroidota bacterium]